MSLAYDEFVDFITSGPTAAAIVDWRASAKANARLTELLDGEREGTLSDADRTELNQYLEVEHLMRLAKARARQRCRVE